MSLIRFFIWFCLAFLAICVHAKGQQVSSQRGPVEYRLDNGLQIILKSMPQERFLHFNLVYRTGSWADPQGKGGTAHLLEHLMFKDTSLRSADAVMQGLRERSIRFNASTSYDRTRYSATLAANEKDLDYLLAWEAERMDGLKISQTTLDAERQVVLREMELASDAPLAALSAGMFAAATPSHGLGRHVLGTREELAGISVRDLRQFHRIHYHPGNATIVITGALDEHEVLKAVRRHFSHLKPSMAAQPAESVFQAAWPESSTIHIQRGSVPWLALAYPLPPLDDEGQVAIAALTDILAGEPHGRLNQSLVQSGQALGVLAVQQGFAHAGYFVVGAVVADAALLPDVQAALSVQLESLRARPVTAQELKRFQASAQQLQSRIMQQPAALADVLSESAGLGDWQLLLRRYDAYARLTLEDVQQQAEKLFLPRWRITAHLLPATAQAAETAAPSHGSEKSSTSVDSSKSAKAADSVADADQRPYSQQELEAFKREVLEIEANTQRGRLGNGMATAVRRLPAGSGQFVRGAMMLRFGDAENLHGQRAASEFTATLLLRGTQQRDHQKLVDDVTALGAAISVVPDFNHVTIRFESPANKLPQVIDLVAEVLQKPAFAENDFDLLKRQRLAALAMPVTQPEALAYLRMARLEEQYPPGDVRRHLERSELLAETRQLTLDDVRAFHARFYGGNHGAAVLSGDINTTATLAQLEKRFGAWNTQQPFVRPLYTHKDVEPTVFAEKTVATQSGYLLARAHFPYSRQAHQDVGLWIAEHVLGRHPIHSRLARRIRIQEGLSYQIGSSLRSARHGNSNSWMQIAGSYPAGQGEKVLQLVQEEWQKLITQGITEDEHRRAVQTILRERHQSLGSENFILNKILYQLLDNETWQQWIDRNEAFFLSTNSSFDEIKKISISFLLIN